MPAFRFQCTWAGIAIDVLSSDVTHGRALVSHTFPNRDGADLEDMGREPLQVSMRFTFFDHNFVAAGEGDWYARFLAFEQRVARGQAGLLIHPYLGEISVRVRDFSHDASGDLDQVINASATFVQDVPQPPTFAAGAGATTRVGEDDVLLRVDEVRVRLDEQGLVSDVLPDITSAMDAWATDDLSAREIQLQMASLNNRLSAELDDFEVATDIDRHPLNKSYTRLQNTLRRAAEAFTTTTTRIVNITVTEPAPLRIIAAQFYSASEAERRFLEMLELNPGLSNPARVEAGTVLKAYSRTVAPDSLIQ